MTTLLAAWVALLNPLGLALNWDEAVFVSQSGALSGRSVHPFQFVASREYGTPALIAALRTVAPDLPALRLLWAALSLGLVVLAFMVMARHVGSRAALIGLVVFVTAWTPTILFETFYGSLLGAAAGLLATALYLDLRRSGPRRILPGLLLGVVVAGLLYMRYLESFLVAAVLAGHALLWRPHETARRWRGVLAAVVMVTLLFALPWTILTTQRFGGIRDWWAATRTQRNSTGGKGHPFGLYNGLDDYGRMLVGLGGHFTVSPSPPALISAVAAAGLVLLVAGTIGIAAVQLRWVRRRVGADRAPDRHPAVLLLFAQCLVNSALFLFLSESLREHYTTYGLIFAAPLAGCAADGVLRAISGRGMSPGRRAGAAVLVLSWLGSQFWLAHTVQNGRVAITARDAQVASAIHALAGGSRCILLGRVSKPQFVVETGCGARGGLRSSSELSRTLRRHRWRPDAAAFVLWSRDQQDIAAAVSGWKRLPDPAGGGPFVLSYQLGSVSPSP